MTRPCVLKCRLHGTAKCAECTLPDGRGAVHCPGCGGPLYWLTAGGGQVRLGCDALKGCGRTVSVPVGSVEAAVDRKTMAAERVRRHRERQKAAA